jgi:hypothetical protein
MRNLNINELVEVQGGRISGSLAISIVGILSDLWTLADAFMSADFQSIGSGVEVDYGAYNAMGDYSGAMCSR